MTDKPIRTRRNLSQPGYNHDIPPISETAAESEPPADRLKFEMPQADLPDPPSAQNGQQEPPASKPAAPIFDLPRNYAEKVYTIHATSSQGFAVTLAFSDISIDVLDKLLASLTKRGYKPR